MLDVRPTAYIVPIAEQEIGPLTPIIRARNFADEDATITGLVRIYRESLGILIYSSELAVTALPHGTSADIAALTPFNPGAPSDDDYFILAEITVTSLQTGNQTTVPLGQYFFDIKPAPMGPPPETHHTTHEVGGMDPVELTGMPGVLAEPQTPANHATTHENGQADAINVAGLHGELADDQPPKAHNQDANTITTGTLDGDRLPTLSAAKRGGVPATGAPSGLYLRDDDSWAVGAGGVTDHSDLAELDYASADHTGFEATANKGIAGGYCGLPDPLVTTLPLRADGTANRPLGIFHESELLSYTNVAPWTANSAGGSWANTTGSAQHPGVCRMTSGAGANSGPFITLNATSLLIAGSEIAEFVIRPQTLAGTTIRAGFHDTTSITAPVDGVYLLMDPNTSLLQGVCISNSASSTTGTSLLMVTNTWYKWRIVINSNASRVDFYCYNAAGNQLWTDNLTTNIPTANGRETAHGVVATNSETTPVALADLDLISIEIARALTR